MRRQLRVAHAVLLLGLLAPPASAQRAASRLTLAGPAVSLGSDSSEETPALANTPLVEGDRIDTAGSRAEALLAGGGAVRFDLATTARFDVLGDGGDAGPGLTLVTGALDVEAGGPLGSRVRVDTDDATVLAFAPALLRVEAGPGGTRVALRRGGAELRVEAGVAELSAGEAAAVKGTGPIRAARAAPADDAFARFAEARRARRPGASARFLALADVAGEWGGDEVSYEGALLDEGGSWIYLGNHGGACFRPSVPRGWRPFASGSWRRTPEGPAWVPSEAWGWLPAHYGAWFFEPDFGWCWRPGTEWSPASTVEGGRPLAHPMPGVRGAAQAVRPPLTWAERAPVGGPSPSFYMIVGSTPPSSLPPAAGASYAIPAPVEGTAVVSGAPDDGPPPPTAAPDPVPDPPTGGTRWEPSGPPAARPPHFDPAPRRGPRQ